MSEFLERWKGYTHQSWHERFVELDRMYSHEAQYNIKALTTLHGTISQQAATIAELRDLLVELERQREGCYSLPKTWDAVKAALARTAPK